MSDQNRTLCYARDLGDRVRVVIRIGGVEHYVPIRDAREWWRQLGTAISDADVMEARRRNADLPALQRNAEPVPMISHDRLQPVSIGEAAKTFTEACGNGSDGLVVTSARHRKQAIDELARLGWFSMDIDGNALGHPSGIMANVRSGRTVRGGLCHGPLWIHGDGEAFALGATHAVHASSVVTSSPGPGPQHEAEHCTRRGDTARDDARVLHLEWFRKNGHPPPRYRIIPNRVRRIGAKPSGYIATRDGTPDLDSWMSPSCSTWDQAVAEAWAHWDRGE